MDVGLTCKFPSKEIRDTLEKCQETMCKKQNLLTKVATKQAELERLAYQDKSMREGWEAAEKACLVAIEAIESALPDEAKEKRRILIAVARKLSPEKEEGQMGLYEGHCGGLIGSKMDQALKNVVMDYWKRKCSKEISRKLASKANSSSEAVKEMQKFAKQLHESNVNFERAVDQINISSSITSKHVVIINWLISDRSRTEIPTYLLKVVERVAGEKDDTYWNQFKAAWDHLKCGGDEGTISVNVSPSWWHKTIEGINTQAVSNNMDHRSEDPGNKCSFRFEKGGDNKVKLTDNGTKVRVELSENGKQQVMNIQVYK
jgi:hypothetical protein